MLLIFGLLSAATSPLGLFWYLYKRAQLNFLRDFDLRHPADPAATEAIARAIGASGRESSALAGRALPRAK